MKIWKKSLIVIVLLIGLYVMNIPTGLPPQVGDIGTQVADQRENVIWPALNISVPIDNADKAWLELSSPGESHGDDVIIGIVDTGVDWTHPDFWERAP